MRAASRPHWNKRQPSWRGPGVGSRLRPKQPAASEECLLPSQPRLRGRARSRPWLPGRPHGPCSRRSVLASPRPLCLKVNATQLAQRAPRGMYASSPSKPVRTLAPASSVSPCFGIPRLITALLPLPRGTLHLNMPLGLPTVWDPRLDLRMPHEAPDTTKVLSAGATSFRDLMENHNMMPGNQRNS